MESVPSDLGDLDVKRQATTKAFDYLITYVPHVWLYAYMCFLWVNEVTIWVIIIFIGCVPCFLKFGGQKSKNVDVIRKVCLETTLCFLKCFVDIYVFGFDEIYEGGPKFICEHI